MFEKKRFIQIVMFELCVRGDGVIPALLHVKETRDPCRRCGAQGKRVQPSPKRACE
jgi:hypothetical protein